jgi:predicted ArsR family transcriptional regulator
MSKRSTRETVLHTIKDHNRSTVDDLAVAAGVSPVTVRHHLNGLLADGLIETDSVRRKVGRPYYVYSISDKGNELFPKTYYALSSRLLDELKARFPPDIVGNLLDGVVQGIVDDHAGEYEHLTVEGRLDFLVGLLESEGFLAKWEKLDDDTYEIIEYSCPLLSIGQTHQEVCTLDVGLIEAVMQTEVEQHSCMVDGDQRCQFSLVPDSKQNEPQLIMLEEVKTR